MTHEEGIGSSKATWQAWDDLYRRQPRTWRGPAKEMEFDGAPGTVLELGCGSGKTLRSLGDHGSIVALDVSLSALKACRREGIRENVHLVQGNATLLPVTDASIDIVVAHHVLGHLLARDRVASAAEIARVLRSGGSLSIRVLSRDDMRCGAGKETEPNTFVRGTGVFCHFFDEDEVRGLFPAFSVKSLGRQETQKSLKGSSALRSEIVAELIRPAAD